MIFSLHNISFDLETSTILKSKNKLCIFKCNHLVTFKLSIYFIFSLITLISCSQSKKQNEYTSFIREHVGKDLLLPDIIMDEVSKDSIHLRQSDFTILTYLKYNSCTKCSMNLPLWNIFMNTI